MDPTADVRFTRIYERHYADVLAYCARRVDRTEAEDVASGVFTVLWRRIETVQDETLAPWLYGVAYRTITNRWRGSSRQRNLRTEAKIRARVEAVGFNTYTVEECVAGTDRRAKCTIRFVAPWFGPIWGEATAPGFGEIAILTIDEAGWISRIGIVNGPIDIENGGLIDWARAGAWDTWITDKNPDLLEEWRFQLRGSDAIERSGAEIVRDYLAAAEEFAAQYGG